jgi:hypothetical protein
MTKSLRYPTLLELQDHITEFLEVIIKEPDVSCALIVGSYIDAALYAILKDHFACKSTAEGLLKIGGPIGDCHKRAQLAYCLGMVQESELKLVKQLSDIRNEFAHAWIARVTFKTPHIAKQCAELTYSTKLLPSLKGIRFTGPLERHLPDDPRRRFIEVGMRLVVFLLTAGKRKRPIKPFQLPA